MTSFLPSGILSLKPNKNSKSRIQSCQGGGRCRVDMKMVHQETFQLTARLLLPVIFQCLGPFNQCNSREIWSAWLPHLPAFRGTSNAGSSWGGHKGDIGLSLRFLWWRFRSLSASAASGHSESHISWGPKVTYLVCSYVKKYIQSMSVAERSLISEVVTLLQLILILPSTNAVSERTFSETPKDLPKGNHESGTPQPSAASTCPQRTNWQAFLHWCG